MKIITILSVLTILIVQNCFSQTSFKFGPEMGFSFSRFPQHTSDSVNRTDYKISKYNPLLSPLIGINGCLSLKKHFQFSFGIQYQMTGTRYYNHRDGRIPRTYDIPVWYTYTSDSWEKQTFHKFCFPLTIGYSFKIKQVHPSVFIGYRPNILFSGIYYYKLVQDASDNSHDYEYEVKYNPVNPDQAGEPVKPFNQQILIGVSTQINPKLSIKLTYNMGTMLHYQQSEIFGLESHYTIFENSDINLSLTCFLNHKENRD